MCHALFVIVTDLRTARLSDDANLLARCGVENFDLMTRAPIGHIDFLVLLDDLLRRLQIRSRHHFVASRKADRLPVVLDCETLDRAARGHEQLAVGLERDAAEVIDLDRGERRPALPANVEGYQFIPDRIGKQEQPVVGGEADQFTKRIVDLDPADDLAIRFQARGRDGVNFQGAGNMLAEVAARVIDKHGVGHIIRISLGTDIARQSNAAVPSPDFGAAQLAAIEIDPHQRITRFGRIGAEQDHRLGIVGRPRTAAREEQCGCRRSVIGQPCAGSVGGGPRRSAR